MKKVLFLFYSEMARWLCSYSLCCTMPEHAEASRNTSVPLLSASAICGCFQARAVAVRCVPKRLFWPWAGVGWSGGACRHLQPSTPSCSAPACSFPMALPWCTHGVLLLMECGTLCSRRTSFCTHRISIRPFSRRFWGVPCASVCPVLPVSVTGFAADSWLCETFSSVRTEVVMN